MDLIKYSSEFSCLNLSAYKFSIFSLLISIQTKEKIQKKTHKLFYAEILYPFITRSTDINNKKLLISELKNTIISKISDINKDLIKEKDALINNLTSLLEENLTSIKTINDLFSFFKQNLQMIKEIILPDNYDANGEEEIEKNIPVFNVEGIGIVDIFIKKCLLNFKRMSFPKLIQLYEDIIKFNNEEILNNTLDNMSIKERENYFSELFNKNSNAFFKSQILNEKNNLYYDFNNKKEGNILEGKNDMIYNDKISNNENTFNHKLFLIHKFYDYHLKYLYNDNSSTNQTKLHYCLLYLTNLYYDCGYYEHALQILFECVKLSQSNCDHEALLKCFLWLSIIYIQKGNFHLASQCLKTCLIKSFQSNYQLLYLISSIELSNLNFIFGASVGLKTEEKKFFNSYNYNNLEEKIISHSNDFEHLLNNIADYFSLNLNSENNNTNNTGGQKGKDLGNNIGFNEGIKNNEDINKMICFTNMHQVIDYMLQGRYSLCIVYLKIIVKELFEEEHSVFNYRNKKYMVLKDEDYEKKIDIDLDEQEQKIPIKEFDSELILQLTNLIISVMEFDFDFCSEYLMKVINLNKILKKNFGFNLINEKIRILSTLMLNKFLSHSKFYQYHEIYKTKKYMPLKSIGIYYSFVQEYYNFVHKFNYNENLISIDYNFNSELILFIEKCKEFHFNTIYKKASILLVKSYIKQGKYTEAMFILSPMIYYNDTIDNNELNNIYEENENIYNHLNKYSNDIDENDLEISKDINVIEYNIHDHIIGVLYQGYICYENEMFSKVELLLNQIKNSIEIYCSFEEKFDFYYLYTIVNKNDFYMKDLLKFAIKLNDENKIEKILKLMKDIKYQNYEKIVKKIEALIEENHKFIEYANSFNCDADGIVEIIYSINVTNNNTINDI